MSGLTREQRAEKEARLAAEGGVLTETPAPKKHKVTTPWKPARVLDVPDSLKDKNFRYRWCTTSKDGNIRKKLSEGWEVDTDLQNKLDELHGIPKTLNDSRSSLGGSNVQVREMILMRMPEERAKSRDEYYAKMTIDPPKAGKDELKKEMSKEGLGGQIYGSITED